MQINGDKRGNQKGDLFNVVMTFKFNAIMGFNDRLTAEGIQVRSEEAPGSRCNLISKETQI